MSQTPRPHLLKMELFGDSQPGTQLPNFPNWLCRFNNWLALQDAQRPSPLEFHSAVQCRSLRQHLAPEASEKFDDFTKDSDLTALETDFDLLCSILSYIFAETPTSLNARSCFFGRKQGQNESSADFIISL